MARGEGERVEEEEERVEEEDVEGMIRFDSTG